MKVGERMAIYVVPSADETAAPLASLNVPFCWTGAGEVRLTLPGGEVSIAEPLAWQQRERIIIKLTQPEDVLRACMSLKTSIGRSSTALFSVRKAGVGPSSKSCKIRVSVKWALLDTGTFEQREHIITVPRSVLVQRDDGQLLAPRWLLQKTFVKRFGREPAGFGDAVWPLRDTVENLFSELLAAAEDLKREQAERSALLAVEREERRANAAIAKARAEAEQSRLDDEKARSEERRAKRMAALETVKVAYIEWDDWVKKNKSLNKITKRAENCYIKISGSRVYILCIDGREVVKQRHNVRYQLDEASLPSTTQ